MNNRFYTTFIAILTGTMLSCSAVFSYEDCIIASDGKLTNIKIEDNTVVDVCPLITIMNEKNILVVHPLKIGQTKVCILKNDKEIIDFEVNVKDHETIVEEVEGLEVLTLDAPDEPIEIDEPPLLEEVKEFNG